MVAVPPAGEDTRGEREGTRDAILTATSHLIAERGLDGFTISDVADRAGVNRSLVYYYFQDRDRLLFETIRHALAASTTGEIEATADTVERFTRMHIEHPEIGRFFFHVLLSGRQLPELSENLRTAIAVGEELKRERAPDSRFDPTFATIHANLGQLAWAFARHEIARHLEMSVEEADERYIAHLRHMFDVGLDALLEDRGEPEATS